MRGIWTLYIDQYGNKIGAHTVRELREKSGGGRVSKMYVGKKVGPPKHIGYVVGKQWFAAYRPVELPAWNILTLDFETYFDDDYSLTRMTTEAYVRDPRFEAHGVGLRRGDETLWIDGPDIGRWLHGPGLDWPRETVLCHHAAFDGLILSHHYGIKPARWLDTYSMAQFLFGPEQSKSLGALASRFGLAPKDVPYGLMKGRHWADMPRETRDRVATGCLHDCELTYEIFQRMMKGDY